MPIPQNGPLALFGYSRPGETAQSKPKQAMIVRMTSETLDALQSFPNHPRLDVLLGENPGVFIGETFFPMLPVKEEQPHEIYLRTSSAGKKNTPLKLYANVVGKFTVERQLDDKLTDKIRESTMDAANQRNNRTAILLDNPPPMAPHNRNKRKDNPLPPGMFRKIPRTSETGRANPINSTPSTINNNTSSPSTSSTHQSKEALASLRQRMIHCIAFKERSAEDIIRFVGGPNCSPAIQRDIGECLAEVAELYSKDKSPSIKIYRLKPESWREVRPFEWPRLNPTERETMARSARAALKSLGIRESDPIWNHFSSRNLSGTALASQPAITSSATRSTSTTEVPKRGITSREAREKKVKVKSDPNAEVMMKDEGARAIRSTQAKQKLKEPSEVGTHPAAGSSTSKTAPLRKPGSGFRVPKTGPNDVLSTSGNASKIVNARSLKDSDNYAQSKPIASSSSPSNNSERRANSALNTQKIKKIRQEDHNGLESDRERQRDRDWNRERIKEQSRNQEKEEGEHSDDNSMPVKRKKDEKDDFSRVSLQKRRKTDTAVPTPSLSSTSKNAKVRDSAFPKRPDTTSQPKPKPIKEESPLPKVRKDPLPLSRPTSHPAGKISPSSTTSSSSQTLINRGENSVPARGNKPNGTSKLRRKSPIYTSSEDEGEIPPSRAPRREAQNSSIPASPGRPAVNGPQSLHGNSRALRSLPVDRAGLRARYRTTYKAYLKTYQRMVEQKNQLDSMLENSMTGTSTDSEGDVELLDTEALTRLASDHKRLKDELESIQQTYSKLTNGGALSD